jgi:chorismate mutase
VFATTLDNPKLIPPLISEVAASLPHCSSRQQQKSQIIPVFSMQLLQARNSFPACLTPPGKLNKVFIIN